MRVLRPIALAALVGAGLVGMGGQALAAPVSSPQHPATFTVVCEGETVVVLEATGAANFRATDTIHGAASVLVSADGAVYQGTQAVGDPVFTFSQQTGVKAGLERVTCERVNTEVVDGVEYTAFETFVLALLPKR